ncbi:hypothetical protein AXA91_14405, partial [Salmonella enterica]|nr:hypothetical protein [Salmonella enterica]
NNHRNSLVSHHKSMYRLDLDEWLAHYNNERPHQGKMCCGRTPMETLLDGKRIWSELIHMKCRLINFKLHNILCRIIILLTKEQKCSFVLA